MDPIDYDNEEIVEEEEFSDNEEIVDKAQSNKTKKKGEITIRPEEDIDDVEIGSTDLIDDLSRHNDQRQAGGFEFDNTADEMGMQIRDGEAADKNIFEDVDTAVLSDEN